MKVESRLDGLKLLLISIDYLSHADMFFFSFNNCVGVLFYFIGGLGGMPYLRNVLGWNYPRWEMSKGGKLGDAKGGKLHILMI